MRPRIGIDAVRVSTLQAYLGDLGSLDLGWTGEEIRDAGGDVEALAAQWAVKEAVMKLLTIGIGEISPQDIRVQRIVGKPPTVRLTGGASERSVAEGVGEIAISITHDGEVVTAVAMAIAKGGDGIE